MSSQPSTNPDVPAERDSRMDLEFHERTWHGFLRFSAWASLHVLLVVGYLTFVFAIGMNWLTALVLIAIAGIVGGLLMGLSSAWYVALAGQALFVVFVRICIALFQAIS